MRFLLIYLLIIAVFAAICVIYLRTQPEIHFDEDHYIVQSGDSLWYISTQYCPDSMDMQQYIQLIKDRNGLSSSVIYPGQRLVVLVEVN